MKTRQLFVLEKSDDCLTAVSSLEIWTLIDADYTDFSIVLMTYFPNPCELAFIRVLVINDIGHVMNDGATEQRLLNQA